MGDPLDDFVGELEAGPLGNVRLSALTRVGKLLLLPAVALIAAVGYFGVTLGVGLITGHWGLRLDDLGGVLLVALLVPTVFVVAVGCGVGFYAASAALLGRCGLRAFSPADGRPVWRVCGVEVRTGLPVSRDFRGEEAEHVERLARESGIEVKTVRKLSHP